MPEIVGAAVYGGSFRVGQGTSCCFVLPGEVVERAVGEPVILEPSANRLRPACVHFGVCGGCQYQHASYPAQLEIKRDLLAGLLAGEGAGSLPAIAVHAGEPWAYRNRIRLRVQATAQGCAVGYSQRGTNSFLPIRMCPIAAPLLLRAAELMCWMAEDSAAMWRWLMVTREVELFCTPGQDRLQVQLLLDERALKQPNAASFEPLCQELKRHMPEVMGAGATMHPESPRRARQEWPGAAWGRPGLLYPAAGREYWVSRGAFFQVNRFLIDTLVRLVTDGRAGVLAWDLFAGVGLFTRPLAENFERVVAVEGAPAACADLQRLARAQPGISPHEQSALSFLQAAMHQRDRPDLVVLDPPRAGLGAEATALLARVASAAIVYVSCDPTTLSRDLSVLLRAGYALESIDLLDLFPQTFHLETVVVLRRSPPAG